MGSRPITFLWLWPATDHEPHCRHVPIKKIWRQTESSGWWCSHMAGIYSDCSTREINSSTSLSLNILSLLLTRQLYCRRHKLHIELMTWQERDVKVSTMKQAASINAHCCLEMRDRIENLLFSCCHNKTTTQWSTLRSLTANQHKRNFTKRCYIS